MSRDLRANACLTFVTEPGVVQAQQPIGQMLVVLAAAILGLTMLAAAVAFGSLVGPWLQSFMAGAPVSLVELVAMRLRKIPLREAVRLRIMAVQSGVPLTTGQLQTAYLRGADVERSVLALIRAKETGQHVTWDELMSCDTTLRCDDADRRSAGP